MSRFLFFMSTVALGIMADLFCQRYLSFFDVAPQFLFLLVLVMGFISGPLMAETLGFCLGLLSDASGVGLFGMNAFLLSFTGYIAGRLRRRIASERPAAQITIAFVGSLMYAVGVFILLHYFEPDANRSLLRLIFVGSLLNVLLITAVFWVMERWLDLWQIQPEQN